MQLRTLADLDYAGKRVLLRADFNVPLKGGKVSDDARIRSVIPTIRQLQHAGCSIVIMSHLGRPDGQIDDSARLDPVAVRLGELLGQPVQQLSDCIGAEVEAAVSQFQPRDVCLLENLRFHAGETKNDPAFATALSRLGDVFVQDAFGCVHRAHASITGVPALLPSSSGLLVAREVAALSSIFESPKRPLVVIVGGAKIDTKIGVLKQFAKLADTILLGGGLANTFLAAEGYEVGESLYEPNEMETAQEIAMIASKKLILPEDAICADGDAALDNTTARLDIKTDALPFNVKILDIGRLTQAQYSQTIASAGTVVWNGPVGLFECTPFSDGTRAIADACATTSATTILGGGDTLDALASFGISDTAFTHVSTGGGAMLEFLEGKQLPGLAVLQK